MLEELPEEGERDPAANSRYDGSYTGQNVRAEMIPDGKVKVSAQLYAIFFSFHSSTKTYCVPLRPSLLFLDGVIASRVPVPGQLRSNTSMASSNPQYSLYNAPCINV